MKKNTTIGLAIIGSVIGFLRLFGQTVTKAQPAFEGFNPDPVNLVRSVAVQSDGKILLGVFFQTVGGVRIVQIAGLSNNNDSRQSLSITPTTIN